MSSKDKIDTKIEKVKNQKMLHQDANTKQVSSDMRASFAGKKSQGSK